MKSPQNRIFSLKIGLILSEKSAHFCEKIDFKAQIRAKSRIKLSQSVPKPLRNTSETYAYTNLQQNPIILNF